jgi:pimeloyl-ACP methyl ester carboxylesterase
VNGLGVGWERRGAGPPLLLCIGSGSTLEQMGLLFGALAAEFDVVGWDYRGFGASDPAAGPYTMADLASNAAGVLDLAGWESCRVFGISFGGMVAQEFAVTYPERVQRLALACTSAGGAGGSSYPLHELAAIPDEERRPLELKLLDSRWSEDWLASHALDRAVAESLHARASERTPAEQAAHLAQLDARRGHDAHDRLDAIGCPTLVAYGRYDGLAPPANSAAIAARIPGAEVRGYEGGHPFLAQDPAALADVIQFLRGEQIRTAAP